MSGRLQPWITIECDSGVTSFTQAADGWMDVESYADATFWVDVTSVTVPAGAMLQLHMETAPTREEAFFFQAAPIVTLVAAPTPTVVRTVRSAYLAPLARWVRWRLVLVGATSGDWSVTFRVRVHASFQSYFSPLLIPNCSLWYRADLGVTLSSGAVQSWVDQSQTVDAGKTLTQMTPGHQPAFMSSNTNYNGAPTLVLSTVGTTYMTCTGWSGNIPTGSTWIVIADNSQTATVETLIAPDSATGGNTITYPPGEFNGSGGGGSWSSPSAFMANGTGVYFNDFTTPVGSPGTFQPQDSLTLGSLNAQSGVGNYWDGSLAEIVVFSRHISTVEITRLRQYFNNRYALSIV